MSDLLHLVIVVVAAMVGVAVARAQPANPVGWLLLGAAAGLAVADATAWLARTGVSGAPWFAWVSGWTRFPALVGLVAVVPLYFPNGLPSGRGWRGASRVMLSSLILAASYMAVRPGTIQIAGIDNPIGLSSLAPFVSVIDLLVLALFLAALTAALLGLIIRHHRAERALQRQIKWLAAALALWVTLMLLSLIAQAMGTSRINLIEVGMVMAATALPAAVGVAILRHEWYDVDLILNRTLVYSALSIVVVVLYVTIVGYLGLALQTDGNFEVSLVATGVVALAFNPLRMRLQRSVNRFVYGDRDDPYAALSRLSRRLDETASPQTLLTLAASEVAHALRVSYVAVELESAAGSHVAAAHGHLGHGHCMRLPLEARGATVGWLSVGSRGAGDLSSTDRGLLEALARPIGATLHAYRLAAELHASRERLVSAREEERGRLHRELHDGLGPELATISMLSEAARDALQGDHSRATMILDDLVERAQDAVHDLRVVVYGLRPPALDTLGLVAALRAHVATQDQYGLHVDIEAIEPHPQLPPAVEVATYRIAIEAITNVIRHAKARHCTLRLTQKPSQLHIEIVDDGEGIAPSTVPGVGLSSMRDRAAELGGDCVVARRDGGGTAVHAWLPLAATTGHDGRQRVAPAGA